MKSPWKAVIRRLDSFANRVTGAGTMADQAEHAEIVEPRAFTEEEYDALVRTNTYAGILVEEIVEESTRRGWKIESPDFEKSEDIDDKDVTKDFDDDWSTVERVENAAIDGRKYGGAALVMVLSDGAHDKPVPDAGKYDLVNIILVDSRELRPARWEGDITNRDAFGRPKSWYVQPDSAGVEGTVQREFHYSRVVYFGGRRVSRRVLQENNGHEDSILMRAMLAIRNKTTTDQARANIVQNFKTDVLKTTDLDGIASGDEQLDYFEARMQTIARSKSNINMILLDEGEEYQKTTTTLTGLPEMDSAATDELTTVGRLPRARLTGESPGGLNTDGESQVRNWRTQVSTYQAKRLRPKLVKLYRVILGAANGPTNGVLPEKWSIEFQPLDEPTEMQIATMRKTIAETDAIYLQWGVVDPDQVADGRFSVEGWKFELPSIEEPTSVENESTTAGGGTGGMNVQQTALNGAQVASMISIVELVNTRGIEPDQAVSVLLAGFPIDEQTARDMVTPKDTTNE